MGIIAANVVIASTGVKLPEAYIGLSRNTLLLNPVGNDAFAVQTAYDIWNSHTDRLDGRAAVESKVLQYQYSSGNATPQSLYTATYDHIKELYPGYADEQTQTPEPAP